MSRLFAGPSRFAAALGVGRRGTRRVLRPALTLALLATTLAPLADAGAAGSSHRSVVRGLDPWSLAAATARLRAAAAVAAQDGAQPKELRGVEVIPFDPYGDPDAITRGRRRCLVRAGKSRPSSSTGTWRVTRRS